MAAGRLRRLASVPGFLHPLRADLVHVRTVFGLLLLLPKRMRGGTHGGTGRSKQGRKRRVEGAPRQRAPDSSHRLV